MNVYQFDREKSDWQLLSLSGSTEKLGLDNQGRFTVGPSVDKILAQLLPFNDSYGRQRWAMIPAGTKIDTLHLNGMIPFALHILQDRDELSTGGQRLYFTTGQPAEIEVFEPLPDQPSLSCPRCKDSIEAGNEVVKCPGCGLWYHESAKLELNCWSYDAQCVCGYPTKNDGAWKPSPLHPKIKLRVRRNEQKAEKT